jgi:hypothetical protein
MKPLLQPPRIIIQRNGFGNTAIVKTQLPGQLFYKACMLSSINNIAKLP